MKIKVVFSYEEIYEDVEKIVPKTESWDQMEIYLKKGLAAFPNDKVKEIIVIDD